jgi:hypothetical protein
MGVAGDDADETDTASVLELFVGISEMCDAGDT